MFGTSPKTTISGIVMIIGGIVRFYFAYKSGVFTEESVMTVLLAITTGIGLILSKDSNVTGGTIDSGKSPDDVIK